MIFLFRSRVTVFRGPKNQLMATDSAGLAALLHSSIEAALAPVVARLADLEEASRFPGAGEPVSNASAAGESEGSHATEGVRLPLAERAHSSSEAGYLASESEGHDHEGQDQDGDDTFRLVDCDGESTSQRVKISSGTAAFVEKAFRLTLSRAERTQLVRAYPRPDTPAAATPSVDRALKDVMDVKRQTDEDLYTVQSRLLDATGPLVALLDAVDAEVAAHPDEPFVPAEKVSEALRAALRLLGSANSTISGKRRAAHLERLDRGLATMGAEEFPEAGEELFGPQLVERLTKRAEVQEALTSILRRLKANTAKTKPAWRSPQGGNAAKRPRFDRSHPSAVSSTPFFRAAGSARYGGGPRHDSRPYPAHAVRHSFGGSKAARGGGRSNQGQKR